MSSATGLRQRLRPIPRCLLSYLTVVRFMGGGPRTFPGGLSKWQWKRLHEKRAQEKEKKLLDEEKQLYQARIRSQIRAKLVSGEAEPDISPSDQHKPMSAKDHIRSLADRFVKAGAEDLWNEDDGPIHPPSVQTGNLRSVRPRDPRLDARNVVDSRRLAGVNRVVNSVNSMNFYGDWQQKRGYSIDRRSRVKTRFNYRKNESSSGEDDSDDGGNGGVSMRSAGVRWPRIPVEDDEDEGGAVEGEVKDFRRYMSSAALGKHDVKVNKRRVLERSEEDVDDEDGLSEQIEQIKQEVSDRKMLRNNAEKSEESFLSDRRFEDSKISPLTVKALTSAGFMQMTRVQEATLSVCIEGLQLSQVTDLSIGGGTSKTILRPLSDELFPQQISSRTTCEF